MTMPRRQLVDVGVTRYYHCISRCVRRAFLCGEGVTHRKAWIEARLQLLAKHFAVSVCGFALPDSHLHIISSSALALLSAAATKSLAATRAQQ